MKLKYYLRGIGFGILISTVVLSLAFGKNTKTVELTDEEIIERAKELGMEEKSSVTIDRDAVNESINKEEKGNTSNEDGDKKNESSKNETPTETPTKDTAEAEEKEEKDTDNHKSDSSEKKNSSNHKDDSKKSDEKVKVVTKKVTIKPGMTAKEVARLLESEGVIADADEFNLYLLENGLTEKIISKKVELEVNTDFKKIAEAITK